MNKFVGYEGGECCLECAHADESPCDLSVYMVFCKKAGFQVHAWGKCPKFLSSEGTWHPRRMPAPKFVDIRVKGD